MNHVTWTGSGWSKVAFIHHAYNDEVQLNELLITLKSSLEEQHQMSDDFESVVDI